ncbi:MarC family protein [Methanoculleus sp. 7T]|uniref:MarC family protein n=1 Tax=Methanoculleus sp. 7T TaxID=2937282 RepID=UPI0020BE6B81|nr:MarC family protein [Methanoculleus sp. 7T]MCK8519099.1 MarC family protein [Methanoculleus sp. 7T]
MDLVTGFADFTAFSLVAIASIIAVMNPASTVAVYTALTEGMSGSERRKVIHSSMKIAFIVLAFFALTGQLIFSIFNITVPAFQIAGGILLVSVATGMLGAKSESYSPEELENIAVVPLAFPLSCGPGTITTVILLASGPEGVLGLVAVFAGIIVALAVSYVGMLYGPKVFAYLGEEGLRVVPKLLAVIVLAIAIQFIINGVAAAMPQILGGIDLSGLI